jgi:hypothetical protein
VCGHLRFTLLTVQSDLSMPAVTVVYYVAEI